MSFVRLSALRSSSSAELGIGKTYSRLLQLGPSFSGGWCDLFTRAESQRPDGGRDRGLG